MEKPLLPFTCRGENEISENIFSTTEFKFERASSLTSVHG
jgi:hypothetical protein